jgi:hypothetical protein
MEVLISMFVLLVGLMGVAAMIPAGRHEILAGAKVDHATAVGRAAFRDLKIRGYLNPLPLAAGGSEWRWSSDGTQVWNPASPVTPFNMQRPDGTGQLSPQPAVAIDPVGAGAGFSGQFPTVHPPSSPHLTRVYPAQLSTRELADIVFRSGDELTFTPLDSGPAGYRDMPPQQSIVADQGGTPVARPYSKLGGLAPLKRASEGNYSWLATVTSDPIISALNSKVIVSVAVFYKRNLSAHGAGESFATVTAFPGAGISGGEIQLDFSPDAQTKFPKGVKPGHWIMLAAGAGGRNHFRWYRVVAADVPTPPFPAPPQSQFITLAGRDWQPPPPGTDHYAFLFDGVIAVYEKNMRLELE